MRRGLISWVDEMQRGVFMKSKVWQHSNLIGRNLKNIRLKCGCTQADLGHILNVTPQQIQKYESGKNRIPLEHLYTLKTCFDVGYDEFFCGMKTDKQVHIERRISKELIDNICSTVEGISNYTTLRNINSIVTILSREVH